MFWGVIIDSGKNFSTVLKNPLHIAMAAMVGNSNDNDKNTIYPVYIKSNSGQNILVCNLSKQNLQVGLDLMFNEGEKLVISTTATGAKIHISGSVINSGQVVNKDLLISRNIDLAVDVKPGKIKSDSASLLSAIQKCKQADRNVKKRKAEETSNVFTKKAKVFNEENVQSNKIGNEISSKKAELLSGIDEEDDEDGFAFSSDIESDDDDVTDNSEDEDTEDEDGDLFGSAEDEEEDENDDEDEENEDEDEDDEDEDEDDDDDDEDEDEDEMMAMKGFNSRQATLKLNKNKQKTTDNSTISAAAKTPQKDSSKMNGKINKLTPKAKNQQTPNKQKNNLGTPNQSILKSPKPETENQQKKTPKKQNQNTPASQQSASKSSQSIEGGKPGKAQDQQTPKKQNQNAKTPYQDTPKPPVHKGDSTDLTAKKTLPGGLVVEDLKLGNGVEAKSGKMISVQYTGRLKSTNKIFDQTPNGRPFNFVLGKGEVIKGWDMGLAGMKVGSKRRLTIPPSLGYGNKGSMPIIPSNSTLEFEVELKSVK